MCKIFGFEDCDFVFKKLDDSHVKNFFIENLIVKTLSEIENKIKNKNVKNLRKYLIEKIGKIYQEYIEPHIYFIFLIIIISIEGGDKIVFKHYLDLFKLFKNFIPFIRLNLSKLVKGVGKLIKDKDKDNEYSEIFFEKTFMNYLIMKN